MRAGLFLSGIGLSLALAACGTDDPPPVCPTGDCTLPGSTIVKWKFNSYPEWMFDSDACSDLGVTTVRVDAIDTADPASTASMEKSCGEGQLTFIDLPLSTYAFNVTPVDIDGNALVAAPVSMTGPAGASGANSTIDVKVPHTAWTRTYTGQFLYRLSWGGMSCTPAMVAKMNLTLTAGGQVTTARNDQGDKLDGTQDSQCWELSQQFPLSVMGLPFGPATLHVVGKDTNDAVLFEKQFDTFIGAGTFNPTFTFDVPAAPPPM